MSTVRPVPPDVPKNCTTARRVRRQSCVPPGVGAGRSRRRGASENDEVGTARSRCQETPASHAHRHLTLFLLPVLVLVALRLRLGDKEDDPEHRKRAGYQRNDEGSDVELDRGRIWRARRQRRRDRRAIRRHRLAVVRPAGQQMGEMHETRAARRPDGRGDAGEQRAEHNAGEIRQRAPRQIARALSRRAVVGEHGAHGDHRQCLLQSEASEQERCASGIGAFACSTMLSQQLPARASTWQQPRKVRRQHSLASSPLIAPNTHPDGTPHALPPPPPPTPHHSPHRAGPAPRTWPR